MGGKPRSPPSRRRESGVHVDRSGRLWHQGLEITHPRLRRALLSRLDLGPGGEAILCLGPNREARVTFECTLLVVVSLRWQGQQAWIRTNDGREQELDYPTLDFGPPVTCRVRNGRLRARLLPSAAAGLAQAIGERDGHWLLFARGGPYLLAKLSIPVT